MKQPKILRFRVTYFYNHPRIGFSNSITVDALDEEQAKEKAVKEISMCYGSDMLKRFNITTATPVRL